MAQAAMTVCAKRYKHMHILENAPKEEAREEAMLRVRSVSRQRHGTHVSVVDHVLRTRARISSTRPIKTVVTLWMEHWAKHRRVSDRRHGKLTLDQLGATLDLGQG